MISRDYESELRELIAENLGVEDLESITRISKLNDDLGADSLDAVELIMGVEDKYKINIPDEEAEKIRTFGDLVDYVTNHYKEK